FVNPVQSDACPHVRVQAVADNRIEWRRGVRVTKLSAPGGRERAFHMCRLGHQYAPEKQTQRPHVPSWRHDAFIDFRRKVRPARQGDAQIPAVASAYYAQLAEVADFPL